MTTSSSPPSAARRPPSPPTTRPSAVTLPAGQIITEAGTAGLTFAKVNAAVRKLNEKDVPFENRFAVVSAAGLEDLLATTQAT